jgi:hypothetical protein
MAWSKPSLESMLGIPSCPSCSDSIFSQGAIEGWTFVRDCASFTISPLFWRALAETACSKSYGIGQSKSEASQHLWCHQSWSGCHLHHPTPSWMTRILSMMIYPMYQLDSLFQGATFWLSHSKPMEHGHRWRKENWSSPGVKLHRVISVHNSLQKDITWWTSILVSIRVLLDDGIDKQQVSLTTPTRLNMVFLEGRYGTAK